MGRSAAFRIASVFSAVFVLATMLLSVAIYRITSDALSREQNRFIAIEMRSLIDEYRREGDAGLLAILRFRAGAASAARLTYGLYAGDGRLIGGAMPAPRPGPGWQWIPLPDRHHAIEAQRALAVDIAPDRRLVVAADDEAHDRVAMSLAVALGVALLAMILIGWGCAVGLAAYLRRRLGGIAGAAEAIIAGDLANRVATGPRDDEFDRLARLINRMLDRVAELLARLREVTDDVAHDLRTPLTRLRNHVEDMLAKGATEEALRRALELADRVLDLFAAMLRVTEIEGGGLTAAFAPVDLTALLQEIGESYQPAAEDSGRRLTLDIGAAPPVHGDRELIAQAVSNLLDNAILHTPAGTAIRLSLIATRGEVRIGVADNGRGIAPAEYGRIVQRFVRLEPSRHRTGHGLGLSLVAAVAQAHGATLTFDDNRPGLIVRLNFPIPR